VTPVLMRPASRRSAQADRCAFRAGREQAGGSSIKPTSSHISRQILVNRGPRVRQVPVNGGNSPAAPAIAIAAHQQLEKPDHLAKLRCSDCRCTNLAHAQHEISSFVAAHDHHDVDPRRKRAYRPERIIDPATEDPSMR
jgi:hypothetical protein